MPNSCSPLVREGYSTLGETGELRGSTQVASCELCWPTNRPRAKLRLAFTSVRPGPTIVRPKSSSVDRTWSDVGQTCQHTAQIGENRPNLESTLGSWSSVCMPVWRLSAREAELAASAVAKPSGNTGSKRHTHSTECRQDVSPGERAKSHVFKNHFAIFQIWGIPLLKFPR